MIILMWLPRCYLHLDFNVNVCVHNKLRLPLLCAGPYLTVHWPWESIDLVNLLRELQYSGAATCSCLGRAPEVCYCVVLQHVPSSQMTMMRS